MGQYSLTKLQQYAFHWLKAFSILCLLSSLAILFVPRLSHDIGMTAYDQFAMILPFAHFGIWAILWGVSTLFNLGKTKSSLYSPYIKENYPSIWKKLHPWGDLSKNSFTGILFLRGKYDDGKDEVMNEIKFQERTKIKLLIWPFLLVAFIWMLNISLILIKSI